MLSSSRRFLFSLDFCLIKFKFILQIKILRHRGLYQELSMLSFKIIRNCYLSVSLASPAAKLTKVRVGQVGFLPRQDSLIIDDDDNYDYCDDNDDDDDDDAWHFFSWSSPEDNRRQQFQTGRHLGLCPPGVLLVL